MTETEIPQLHLSRDHIMAMTQVLTMLSLDPPRRLV